MDAIDEFSPSELFLYEDPTISIVLKSWLVFYRFGLKNLEIFEAIKHGDHRPWHFAEVYVNAPWGFNPQYTQPLQDTVDGPAAVEYWYGLLDLWADLCFQFGN